MMEKHNDNILNIYQMPKNKNDKENIMEYDIKPSFSKYRNMPLFKYGFYYYIHQTKNKMEMFDKPEFKQRDIYKIVNPYEDTVPQEDYVKQFKDDKYKPSDDINSMSIKYFQSDRIISRAFYKLWELLMMFPLIKDGSKSITSVHIAEAPGSFVQSVIYYRHKFASTTENQGDTYIATSIEPDKKSSSKKEYIPTFNEELKKIKQFRQWSYKDSDLTKTDIINKFISDNYDVKADLVTADGGFPWRDENFQEQEAYILLLSEIYCGLKVQKEGGTFVLKIFETFTEVTVKMIEILKRYYEQVILIKPLLSRPSNSEKYLICLNYSPSKNLKHLDKLYDTIKQANKDSNLYLTDIFPEYNIDPQLDLIMKLSSTKMSNEQHRQINRMISYMEAGNYYGEEYRKCLVDRREANDTWISLFYPTDKKDLNGARSIIKSMISKKLEYMKYLLEELKNKLSSI